jgi:uncharacterized cupredoxin-like copper-binding protein
MIIPTVRRSLGLAGALAAIATMLAIACGPAAAPTTAPPAPAIAREPSRLEARVTIEMGDFVFATDQGVKGGPFRVPAGKTVGIHIVNRDEIEHEVLFGRDVAYKEGLPDGYTVPLFGKVPADVFVYPSGKKVEAVTDGGLGELELEPGAEVWLRVNFPAELKGEWEIGCFVAGHYERGMKAKFIIE